MYLNDKDSLVKKGNELPEILLSHSAAVVADEITNMNAAYEEELFLL